jgi:hypothetical protein
MIFPTPLLAHASAANEPTPPIPKMATVVFFKRSTPSDPIANSFREN